MNVYIKNKQPVPCIYNVKQYTSGDEFVFHVPLSEVDGLDNAKLTSSVMTESFTTKITPSLIDGYAVIDWKTKDKETAVSGRFEFQIEITDGESVWRSYKTLLVISDSVEGGGSTDDTPVTPTVSGDISGVIEMSGSLFEDIESCNVDDLEVLE